MSSDIVDVLLEQHDELRRLCTEVEHAIGAEKKRLFDELDRLVSTHELGERRVVHPATRNSTPEGDRVGVACMTEEGSIERAMAELQAMGVAHTGFDDRFTTVHQAIVDHAAHEERDEFPILRRHVSTEHLHRMVGQLHDIQVMAVG